MKPAFLQSIKYVLISLLFLFSFFTARAQNDMPPPPPPSVKAGLEINRTVLINKITAYDSTMVFKQESDVDGLSDFIGIDKYKTTIRLIGKEDELTLAKWTFAFSADKITILKEIDNMGYFVFIMGEQQGVDWMRGKLNEMINNHYKAISETHSFNYNRQAQFKYDPQSRLFILTFIQWGASFD